MGQTVPSAWRLWVEDKYPNMELNDADIARLYLRDHGAPIRQEAERKLSSSTRPSLLCPKCNTKMEHFPVCGGCEMGKKGFLSVWICPRSKGLKQEINSDNAFIEGSENTYARYFVLAGKQILSDDCDQTAFYDMDAVD